MNFSLIRKNSGWMVRCESWLNQFSKGERPIAELLLDSVNYITHEDVCSGLQNSAEKMITGLKGPCAVYPITNRRGFKEFEEYKDMPFGVGGDLGSEGDLGHLCRDLGKASHSKRVFSFPSLDILRKEKVRHIILLT